MLYTRSFSRSQLRFVDIDHDGDNDLFVGKEYNKRIKENIKTIKKLPKIKGVKEIVNHIIIRAED